MQMLSLRPSTASNIPFFVEMERDDDNKRYVIPYSATQHQQMLDAQHVHYLNIYYLEQLIGFVILAFEAEGSVELRRIIIKSKGQGLGQQTIKLVEQHIQTHFNCQRIWLDVYEENKRGQHIYKKLGYQQFDSTDYNGKQLLFLEKQLFNN